MNWRVDLVHITRLASEYRPRFGEGIYRGDSLLCIVRVNSCALARGFQAGVVAPGQGTRATGRDWLPARSANSLRAAVVVPHLREMALT